MKKVLISIIAFLVAMTSINAQTVENSTVFENTYVTFSMGPTTAASLYDEGVWGTLRPAFALEFGKYITPVVGFSIEGIIKANTLGTSTLIDQHNLVGNLKFNLSNWFAGYKGYPRAIEFVFVPGLGWGHVYGHYRDPEDPKVDVGNGVWTYPNDVNYLTYNLGLETNINFGKAKAWQINIKPVVFWDNMSKVEGNLLRPLKENFKGALMLGVTYKFLSPAKQSHNFVLCPYSYTKGDYDAVVAERDALNRKYVELLEKHQSDTKKDTVFIKEEPKEEVEEPAKETPVVKEIEKETIINRSHVLSSIVTFPIGSAEVSEVELAKIDVFARSAMKDENVTIIGSADSGTGTDEGNRALSMKRAEAIRDILVEEYGFDADKIKVSTAFDTNESPTVSRSAILNVVMR